MNIFLTVPFRNSTIKFDVIKLNRASKFSAIVLDADKWKDAKLIKRGEGEKFVTSGFITVRSFNQIYSKGQNT